MTTKRVQRYETAEIIVTFDPNRCVHSAVCVRGLPAVFDVRRKRWVQPELATAAEVAAQVERCPSGALQYRLKSASSPAIPPVTRATPQDRPRIFEVWEASVRATHHFLAEDDIQFLIPRARTALATYEPLHCLRNESGEVDAFIGVAGVNIDLLFVHPARRGMGLGRTLVEFAIRELGATDLDVNEQNPQAVGFYEHLGFRTISRSPLDAQGRPFPILHMRLAPQP